MITIGSVAYPSIPRRPGQSSGDLDLMMTESELRWWLEVELNHNPSMVVVSRTTDYAHIRNSAEYENVEIYIGHSGNSTERLLAYCENVERTNKNAELNVLYAIKMSHRYKRNSPHFLKTLRDIQFFRHKGANLDCEELQEIVKLREKESYNYTHPVLNQSKENFFSGDGIDYVYDHDTIHEAIALGKQPAYTYYIQDGAAVMTSKEKFFAVHQRVRLAGVYEEVCVLALERSQIPFDFTIDPKHSFITALIKVCSSITSGWFREFAWENFDTIIAMYRARGEDDYVKRFKANESVLKPFGWDTEIEQHNPAEV